jgi:membrane peptidoglycan carboxypeptidase
MNGGFYSNYGGSRGRSKRSLTARQAFARSDNLAVMWRLDRSDITQKNMSSLLEAFGFKLNPPTSAPSRSALIEAIALGKAIARPETVIACCKHSLLPCRIATFRARRARRGS